MPWKDTILNSLTLLELIQSGVFCLHIVDRSVERSSTMGSLTIKTSYGYLSTEIQFFLQALSTNGDE